MVFEEVTSDGEGISSFILPHSLRLNMANIKCLEEIVVS